MEHKVYVVNYFVNGTISNFCFDNELEALRCLAYIIKVAVDNFDICLSFEEQKKIFLCLAQEKIKEALSFFTGFASGQNLFLTLETNYVKSVFERT